MHDMQTDIKNHSMECCVRLLWRFRHLLKLLDQKNIVFLNELRESLKHIPHTEELVDGIFRNIAIQNSF